MIYIVIYLISILICIFWVICKLALGFLNLSNPDVFLATCCCLSASIGGILYCLRSVYLNRCAHKRWDPDWTVWYFIRPVASAICGIVAFLVLKAGLIVLDASQNQDPNIYGYLVFAFLAGLNVDRFIGKLEEIGKSVFGIELSRVASEANESRSGDTK